MKTKFFLILAIVMNNSSFLQKNFYETKKLAKKGSLRTQYNLALMYYNEDGTATNKV